MASEGRRLKRAREQKLGATSSSGGGLSAKAVDIPDPRGQIKGLLLRLGLPLLAIWMLCGLIAGVVYSSTTKVVLIAIPSVLTLVALGLLAWVLRQAGKARGVADILRSVESQEDRKAALDKLGTFKKNDPAAIFARAQLELQEDPRKALATLEQINLQKVLSPIADEARAQRAMIHLMLGEASPARDLADGIELSRHQEARTRAMMVAVCSEAWARTGVPKKAMETLKLIDPEDDTYRDLRPQLYRASAYACAHLGDQKGMRRALKKLLGLDARLLSGFLVKRTHPLLQKEAKRMIEQSGILPRRMVVQRS